MKQPYRGRVQLALVASISLMITTSACGGDESKGDGAPSTGKPETAAEIALYQGADRQQILEACAREEGKVSMITGTFVDTVIDPLAKKFNEKYPYIKVEAIRMDEPDMVRRILEEGRARRTTIDVLDNEPQSLNTVRSGELLQAFSSPFSGDYPEGTVEPGKPAGAFWVGHRQSIMAPVYNTKSLPADLVPKSHDDLLQPELKGKIVVADSTPLRRFVSAILKIKGEEAGLTYLKALAAQDVRVYDVSVRALVDLVGGGEAVISPTALGHHAEEAKSKGAPVDWARVSPLIAWTNSIARVKDGPHPCSAALWTDYMLDPSGGQAGYSNVGYLPTHPDAKGKYDQLTDSELLYGKDIVPDAEAKRIEDLTREIFLS